VTDHDEFLGWVRTALYEAERALHNGDAAPRRALWSRNEPVSVLGAWRSAHGQQGLSELFAALGNSFSWRTPRQEGRVDHRPGGQQPRFAG
jgi:hypothetical protein